MKFKKILVLSLSLLLVTSCNGDNSYTSLPNEGTLMTSTQGVTALTNSIDAYKEDSETDAFGLTLDDGYFSNSIKGDISLASTNSTYINLEASASFSNFDFYFGTKGLKGNSVNDLVSSLYTGFDFEAKYNFASAIDSSNGINKEFSKKNYDLKLDLLNDKLYIDLSNENTYELIETLLTYFLASSYSSITLSDDSSSLLSYILKPKSYINLGLSDVLNMPLIDDTVIDSLASYIKELPNEISFGEFKDHGDNTYSFSAYLGTEELNELNEGLGAITFSSRYEFNDIELTFNEGSNFNFALIFNEYGLISFGMDYSVDFSFNANYEEEYIYDYDITSEAGFKVNFVLGDSVKFNDIDTSTYTELAFVI